MSTEDRPFGVPGSASGEGAATAAILQHGGPMASTGATEEEEIAAVKAANRFDIRRLIGALFLL